MAKLTKKTVDLIFNDFKDSIFISSSLVKYGVNQYDFFEYLKSNEEADNEYKKIAEYNNFILEDREAQKAFSDKGNSKIRLEMIKANNKKKYTQKVEIEQTTTTKDLSDAEVDSKIEELLKKLSK